MDVIEVIIEPLGYPSVLINNQVVVPWCEWEDLWAELGDAAYHFLGIEL